MTSRNQTRNQQYYSQTGNQTEMNNFPTNQPPSQLGGGGNQTQIPIHYTNNGQKRNQQQQHPGSYGRYQNPNMSDSGKFAPQNFPFRMPPHQPLYIMPGMPPQQGNRKVPHYTTTAYAYPNYIHPIRAAAWPSPAMSYGLELQNQSAAAYAMHHNIPNSVYYNNGANSQDSNVFVASQMPVSFATQNVSPLNQTASPIVAAGPSGSIGGNTQQYTPQQHAQQKKRPHAVPIIHPETKEIVDVDTDSKKSEENSQQQSEEKMIAARFAQDVANVALDVSSKDHPPPSAIINGETTPSEYLAVSQASSPQQVQLHSQQMQQPPPPLMQLPQQSKEWKNLQHPPPQSTVLMPPPMMPPPPQGMMQPPPPSMEYEGQSSSLMTMPTTYGSPPHQHHSIPIQTQDFTPPHHGGRMSRNSGGGSSCSSTSSGISGEKMLQKRSPNEEGGTPIVSASVDSPLVDIIDYTQREEQRSPPQLTQQPPHKRIPPQQNLLPHFESSPVTESSKAEPDSKPETSDWVEPVKGRGKKKAQQQHQPAHQKAGSKSLGHQQTAQSGQQFKLNGDVDSEPKSRKKGKKAPSVKKGVEKDSNERDLAAVSEKQPVHEKTTSPSVNINLNNNNNTSQKTVDKLKHEVPVKEHVESKVSAVQDHVEKAELKDNAVDGRERANQKERVEKVLEYSKLEEYRPSPPQPHPQLQLQPPQPQQQQQKREVVKSVRKSEKASSVEKLAEKKRLVYAVDMMKGLRGLPASNKTVKLPEAIQFLIASIMKQEQYHGGYSGVRGSQNHASIPMPGFMQKSTPQRRSQQGMKPRGNDPKQGQPVHITLSLREDVQLHKTKEAWKPARFVQTSSNMSEEDRKNSELYKTVISILNKLTPEKFSTLVGKIKALPIETKSQLQGVIDRIFEKAIDEPGFCQTYAMMCSEIADHVKVAEAPEDTKLFKTTLITKCQTQFERNKEQELDSSKKLAEIEAETDPAKKKELQLQYEEEERKIRRKQVGNSRFIGELFKLNILTGKIMLHCVGTLMNQIDEESLECMCKLMTTIGKDLENKVGIIPEAKVQFSGYFNDMKKLSQDKRISSRIRFMLQDVIELRERKWVPRRDENAPKTMEQITIEIERNEYDNRMQAAAASMNRKSQQQDDYNRGRDMRDRDRDNRKGGRSGSNDDWQMVQARGSYSKNAYQVDPKKLSTVHSNLSAAVDHNVTLGPSRGSWAAGSGFQKNAAKPSHSLNYSTGNSSNVDPSKSMLGRTSLRGNALNRVTPSNSMEKYRDDHNRNMQGSSSQTWSRNNEGPMSRSSMTRDQGMMGRNQPRQQQQQQQQQQQGGNHNFSLPGFVIASHSSTVPLRLSSGSGREPSPAAAEPPKDTPKEPPIRSQETLESFAKMLMEEFMSASNNNVEDLLLSFQQVHKSQYAKLIGEMFVITFEKMASWPEVFGNIIHILLKNDSLPTEVFVDALRTVLAFSDDWSIDYPKIYDCIVSTIVLPMMEGTLDLNHILAACKNDFVYTEFCCEFLALLFKTLKEAKGEKYVHDAWTASEIKLEDFVQANKVKDFVKEHSLEYLMGQPAISAEDLYILIRDVLTSNAENKFAVICDWVDDHDIDHHAPELIEGMSKAFWECAIKKDGTLDKDMFAKDGWKLCKLYLKYDRERDFVFLNHMHENVKKLEYPKGLLLDCAETCYDESSIMPPSIVAWIKENQNCPFVKMQLETLSMYLSPSSEMTEREKHERYRELYYEEKRLKEMEKEAAEKEKAKDVASTSAASTSAASTSTSPPS